MALTDIKKGMRLMNRIIVHSSNSDIATTKSIEKMHQERGMKYIGYHFIILRDGKVEKGRDVALIGEHTTGHNLDSIGICIVGKEDFTTDQLISLGSITQALLSNYPSINHILRGCDLLPPDSKQQSWCVESVWFDKPNTVIVR